MNLTKFIPKIVQGQGNKYCYHDIKVSHRIFIFSQEITICWAYTTSLLHKAKKFGHSKSFDVQIQAVAEQLQ